jgi:hypothetical protein
MHLVMMQASSSARTSHAANASFGASFPKIGDPIRGIFGQFL